MVIINPGSGPVSGACYEDATRNAGVFAADVDAETWWPAADDGQGASDGRWRFYFLRDGVKAEVEVPGLPLERVRYLGADHQNIWDFPRLYVDGSSWVWEFAVRVTRRAFSGES